MSAKKNKKNRKHKKKDMEIEEEEQEVFVPLDPNASETTVSEREFLIVLEKLRKEDMKYYSDIYTKLYDFYFMKKEDCLELEKEIAHLHIKIDKFDATIANYVSEVNELNATIEKLNADLAETKAVADAMHTRELNSLDNFNEMKLLVLRLEKELNVRQNMVEEETGPSSADMKKEKEKFEKEILRLQTELDTFRFKLNVALKYQADMEERNNLTMDKVHDLEEKLEDAAHETMRYKHANNVLNANIKELHSQIEERTQLLATTLDKMAKSEEILEERSKQLKTYENKVEKALQEQEAFALKAKQTQDLYNRTSYELRKTKEMLDTANRQLKVTLDDSNKLNIEMNKLNKTYKLLNIKFENLEKTKTEIDIERNALRKQMIMMDKELLNNKKQAEADKRELENSSREKNLLKLYIQKIELEAQENMKMMQVQELHRQQLQKEMEAYEQQMNKQRSIIRQLEKDKDRLIEETIALNEKIDEVTDEVRLLNAAIIDLKKELREENVKTRKLSVDLDSCRADASMLRKKHAEDQDLLQDLKQKLKMLAYQIEMLKGTVTTKEALLHSSEMALAKSHKKADYLRMQIQIAAVKFGEVKAELLTSKEEEANLNRIIQEENSAKSKLMKVLEGMVNERDVIGAQLVRRNDEISLLYERMRIVQVTLQRGERQYEERVEDIRLLRLEILRLRKEKNLLAKGIENMTDLRLEVFNLERELGRERLRVRALEESLMTPVNVHRWRKLQDTNPDSLRLVQKLRVLQQKVLNQSETLILKDRELKQTQNLYKAVKEMLALQPSPDIKNALNRTQIALTQRTRKMRCLIAEVNMNEKIVTDLRLELDRAQSDLKVFKRKYYAMKRVLDMDEARRLKINSMASSPCADTCESRLLI